MRKTLAAGFAVAALAAVGMAAPATAANYDGQTVLTFAPKTWTAIDAQMMVEPIGKATPINVRSYGFPAMALDQDTIATKGGLAFVRADASLKVKKMVLDLSNDSVTATIPGVGTDYELFDLANVKQTKKSVKARANLAMGQAALLNQALKTDIFVDGMRIGKLVFTY